VNVAQVYLAKHRITLLAKRELKRLERSQERGEGRRRLAPKLLVVAVWASLGSNCPVQAQQWSLTSAPSNPWSSIACSADASKVVAVGYEGPMYLSTNSGVDWNPVVLSGSPWITNWVSVAASADGNKLVAATSDYRSGLTYPQTGLIYFSTNSGASWVAADAPAAVWSTIAMSADGAYCLAGIGGYPGGPIYSSTNSGANWVLSGAPTNGEQWSAVAVSADGAVGIASSGPVINGQGLVCTSTNAGTAWQTSTVPALPWASVACSADGRRLFAVPQAIYFMGFTLHEYPIYGSSDFGSTWSEVPSSANPWNGVASSADGLWWTAVTGYPGGNGWFYLWTNGYGEFWYSTNISGESLNAVACSADGAKAFAASSHIYAFSTAPRAPLLSISITDHYSVISWNIPSTGWVLEKNENRNDGWNEVAIRPTVKGIRYEVTLPTSGTGVFYRLRLAMFKNSKQALKGKWVKAGNAKAQPFQHSQN
jgi:hypothetical protein